MTESFIPATRHQSLTHRQYHQKLKNKISAYQTTTSPQIPYYPWTGAVLARNSLFAILELYSIIINENVTALTKLLKFISVGMEFAQNYHTAVAVGAQVVFRPWRKALKVVQMEALKIIQPLGHLGLQVKHLQIQIHLALEWDARGRPVQIALPVEITYLTIRVLSEVGSCLQKIIDSVRFNNLTIQPPK